MSYQHLKLRRLCGAGGAEITDVDLANEARAAAWDELRAALVEFHVVTIPCQPLDDLGLVSVAQRLGRLGAEPYVEGESSHPNVVAVIKEADETQRFNFGGSWHSDWSFLPNPPSFTLLHARDTPPYGGDTWFANQHLAYESLSTGLREMLAHLRAVHSGRRTLGPQSVFSDPNYLRSMKVRPGPAALAEQVHPAVRRHVDSGRAALFLNPVYTIRFDNMTEQESTPLLAYLHQHSVRPEFVIRVSWKPGTLTIWDNRAVQHLAVNDYDGFRRDMRRVTVAGEAPLPVR